MPLSLLLAAALLFGVPAASVRAAEDDGTRYIVKLRSDSEPFRVVNASELRALLGRGLTEWYEKDGTARLIDPAPEDADLPAGSDYYDASEKWDLEMIGADRAFSLGRMGQGVRVGVVDSGIAPHPALTGRLLPGHNYIAGASDPDDTVDRNGHGTGVAGLIAGSTGSGYIGAAPMAELVPLKCTDTGDITISDLCLAIYGGVDDYHCDVINLSLAADEDFQSVREAVAYAREKNVIVVAAVGNSGSAALWYPASYDTVIGVGAVKKGGLPASCSNFNESVFLSAPGERVRTLNRSGGYSNLTGTSFATPLVSAAAAVLLGINDSLTPEDVMGVLAGTAGDAGAAGWDEHYGHGILDLGSCAEVMEGSNSCAFFPASGPAATARNFADEPLRCVYLLAEYAPDGMLQSLHAQRLTLPAHGSAALAQPAGAAFGQFLCAADAFVPIIPARKSNGVRLFAINST